MQDAAASRGLRVMPSFTGHGIGRYAVLMVNGYKALKRKCLPAIEQAQSPHNVATTKGNRKRRSQAPSQSCKTWEANNATAVAFGWLTNPIQVI